MSAHTRFLYRRFSLTLNRHPRTTGGRLSGFQRPFTTENPPPTALMSGTVRYPATAVIMLARRILTAYEAHLDALEDAFADPDSEERWDILHEIQDIHMIYWNIDRQRWTEIEEKYRGEKIPIEELAKSVDFGDPKLEERNLLKIGRSRHADVFWKAIQSWKDKKEQAGAGGELKSEDALVDFLEFLSLPDHADLFDVK